MKGFFNSERGFGVEIEFLVQENTSITQYSGSDNKILDD